MPAVTFQCGNCKNLLAVEDHLLGQQVRCPHCQQVLVAQGPPALSPTARPIRVESPSEHSDVPADISLGFSISTPPHHEEESIFTTAPRATEDLFGEPAPGQVVDLPSEPAPGGSPRPGPWQESTTNGSAPIVSSDHSAPAPEATSSTEAMAPPAPSREEAATTPLIPSEGDWPVLDSSSPAVELPREMEGPDVNRRVAQRAKRESLFTTYLIIILIPYAIFITCVAAYFYLRMRQMPNPMEFLRDSGENPPAKRGTSSVLETISPETKLPPRLQVALGQQLHIGDLEIQPQKVERRKITIGSERNNVQPETGNDALVLTLRLRNVSQDVYFTPTDPVFDRQWKGEFGSNRPYTLLDIGGSRFFGGPIKWKPRGNRGRLRDDDPREFVKGQEHDNQILKPGGERTSIFCTDPGNREILKVLKSYEGPLVWRVHLRRGLVQVGEREVSATAVIGVVFDKKDIIDFSSSTKH